MKYRKKPVVIEAMQYDGTDDNFYKLMRFCKGDLFWEEELGCPLIETLEGNLTVSVSDYVIKGVSGEFYPCKPDIFDKTYEVVIDDRQTESD